MHSNSLNAAAQHLDRAVILLRDAITGRNDPRERVTDSGDLATISDKLFSTAATLAFFAELADWRGGGDHGEVKASVMGKIAERESQPSTHPHGQMFTVTADADGLFRYLAPLQIAGKTHVGTSGGFLTRAEAEACAKRDERKWRAGA